MDAEERERLRELSIKANASRAWMPSWGDEFGPYEALLLFDALDAAEAERDRLRAPLEMILSIAGRRREQTAAPAERPAFAAIAEIAFAALEGAHARFSDVEQGMADEWEHIWLAYKSGRSS